MAMPPHLLFLVKQISQFLKTFLYLRVESGSGILHFLNEAGHVLEEEIVEMFLLHILQFEGWLLATSDHVESED